MRYKDAANMIVKTWMEHRSWELNDKGKVPKEIEVKEPWDEAMLLAYRALIDKSRKNFEI